MNDMTPPTCECPAETCLGRVACAVVRRAEGYVVPLKKTIKLKRASFDPTTGKKIAEEEVLADGVEEIYVPGDLRAAAYYLNNRAPDRWRDNPTDTQSQGTAGGVVILPDVVSTPEPTPDTPEEEG